MSFYVWEPAPSRGACSLTGLQNVERQLVIDLMRGYGSVQGRFPAGAEFHMDPQLKKNVKLEDHLVNNPQGLPVISAKFRDFLIQQDITNVEWLPVTIVDHQGKAVAKEYVIANVLEVVDCVDQDASDFTWNKLEADLIAGFVELVIDESRVPAGLRMFRMKYFPNKIIVDEALRDAIEGADLSACELLPVEEFTG